MLSALTRQAHLKSRPYIWREPGLQLLLHGGIHRNVDGRWYLVTTRIVEPMLEAWDPSLGDASADAPTAEPGSAEARAFGVAMGVGVLCAIGLALLGILPGAPLRDAFQKALPRSTRSTRF